jgi:hypothetical protein
MKMGITKTAKFLNPPISLLTKLIVHSRNIFNILIF